MSAEERFAESAADLWEDKRKALLDPEQSFFETEGLGKRYPDGEKLERAFRRLGVPYRDYGMDGMEWLRKVGSR